MTRCLCRMERSSLFHPLKRLETGSFLFRAFSFGFSWGLEFFYFLKTTCYLFSNFYFIIWFSLYEPLMPRWHACGGHNAHRAVLGTWRKSPRFHWKALSTGPKEGSKKKGLESFACPLRSQNANPAPYVKFPQQGPNMCDTKRIHSAPVDRVCWLYHSFAPTPALSFFL